MLVHHLPLLQVGKRIRLCISIQSDDWEEDEQPLMTVAIVKCNQKDSHRKRHLIQNLDVSNGKKRALDESSATNVCTKRQKTDGAPSKEIRVINVFTDGSSIGNGRPGATAGYGVHFPEGRQDSQSDLYALDESARVSGPDHLQTSFRAELTAIVRAVQLNPDPEARLFIHTDCQNCIWAIEEWQHVWRKNGWKNRRNEAVTERDLIERLELEMQTYKHRPTLVKVKAHSRDEGNDEADRLAGLGSRLPPAVHNKWHMAEPRLVDNGDDGEGDSVSQVSDSEAYSEEDVFDQDDSEESDDDDEFDDDDGSDDDESLF